MYFVLVWQKKKIDSYGPFSEEHVNDYNYSNQSTSALSENTDELCDRLKLIIQ